MARRRTAEEFCRLYYGVATPSFGPDVRRDSDLRELLTSWGHSADYLEDDELFAEVFRFSETEFYERVKEIAAEAAKVREVPTFRFNYLRVANYEALVSQFEQGEPLIFIDADYIDVLVAFFASRIFETYYFQDRQDRLALNRYAMAVLKCFVDGQRIDDDLRKTPARFFASDQHGFGVAVSLSRTAVYFIVAHEIAHMSLGHQGIDNVYETELEADELGAEIYQRLSVNSSLSWATVPDGYKLVPLLYLEFLNTVEGHVLPLLGRRRGDKRYPMARVRRDRLKQRLMPSSEKDRGLFIDMRQSIARLNVYMRSALVPGGS